MKSVRYALLALLLLVSIAGCRDHQETVPDEISDILGLKISRPLEVAMVSPQGDTTSASDYEAVTVVFNQPMKSLSAEAPAIDAPFKIEPAVTGKFRWKGTATVSFEPTQPLPSGTEFKITVPAGLKAAGGAELAKEASYTFTTPGPHVISSVPVDNSTDFQPGKPIILVFDQDVDPTKVGAVTSFTGPANAPKPTVRSLTDAEVTALNKDRKEEEPPIAAQHAVAVDAPGLAQGTVYTLRVDKGLKGEVGPRASAKESVLAFTTLAPFAFKAKPQTKPTAPEEGVTLDFSTDVSLKALKEHLTISPKLEIAKTDYDDADSYASQTLYLPMAPNTTYTLTVDKGLTDSWGQTLGTDVTVVWKTGDRAPLSQMAEGIAVLEASGKLSIPMGLRNIDKQTIRMAVLGRAELSTLLADNESDWMWSDKGYTPAGGFSVQKTFVPKTARNQMADSPLDLTEVLKGRKFGFVFYEVASTAGKETFRHRGLAQVTNLGVTGKFSPENSVFVATSLDKAALLANVDATVTDGKGKAVWQGRSGKDGRVLAPGWSELVGPSADAYEQPPMTLFLKQGADEAFIRNGGFGGISPYDFDISSRWTSSKHYLAAQIYTERGLYRPGDEVQLKGALRDRSGETWINADVKSLDFELFDARDQSVEKGTVDLSAFGTFHHTLKIPLKAATGAYRVDYKLSAKQAESWGVSPDVSGASFQVEEFQPADFEVTVTRPEGSPSSVSMGDTVPFHVLGSWLFGSPMNAEKLVWSSFITPSTYSHKDFPGFDFGPVPLDGEETSDVHQDLSSGKGVTDNKGLFAAEVALQGIAYRGDGELTVEGTVTSSNRRSITGRMVVPVSRGAYRIGLKPNTRFAQGGQPVTLQTVTLDLDGKPVSGKALKMELIRREWNSVRKTDADGSFRWATDIEDKVVDTKEITSGSAPTDLALQPKTAGYHIARVTSADGKGNTVLSETGFYAEGTDSVAWGRVDGDKIDLVSDKTSYVPGETAKILVKSPYEEATALITYERDTVLYSYTTKLNGNSPVIDVPLTDAHLPNLYVSVLLMRGRVAPEADNSEEDTGKPSFKIGYINLPVTPDGQRLKVELKTDKAKYGPADEVVTTLKVSDAKGQPVEAELSLTAADVGVLNLIDYKTPDFFDTFYGSLPLAVRSADNRMDVIGQRSYGSKGEDQGGGGGYNPGFRSDFRLTALWEPAVVTDKNGMAEVRFKLPENLTTFRVMATAISKDTRCGSAETEIVLSKPLVLKASAPAFARVGDDFQAGVLAVNGSGEDHSLKVSLEATGIEAMPAPQEVFLKAGEEREVLFALKATKEGTATLRFSGALDKETDALQIEIPLKTAYQRVTLATNGATNDKAHTETAKVPATVVEGSAQVTVSLSPTILNGLQASITQLADYPYGCLEQRLSRLTPLLFTEDLVGRFGLQGWPEAKVKTTVQENLDLIAGYAAEDGGLKVWPDSIEADPYLTALAVRTADIAQTSGYKVSGSWRANARTYLKNYLDGSSKALLDFNEAEVLATKAAALAALSDDDFAGKSYLNSLMDRREKMPAIGRAYLLEAASKLGVKDSVKLLTTELTNGIKVENATAYFDVDGSKAPWLYSSDAHDTGVILAALLKTGSELPVADKVVTWLLEARDKSGTWGTTADNAAALEALWAYAEKYEGKVPTFTVTTTVGGAPLAKTAEFSAEKLAAWVESIPLKAGDTPIEIKKSGDGRLYYSVQVAYNESKPLPAVDEGMTVMRAVTSLDGKRPAQIKGGEIYKVQLSVIAPTLRRFVVLEDPIPAGFEVVKTDFATESSKLGALLEASNKPGWQTFFRFESYADRILLFADALAPGEHNYEYLVRAMTPGTYAQPATTVEEMYHPELFGRTAPSTVTVAP